MKIVHFIISTFLFVSTIYAQYTASNVREYRHFSEQNPIMDRVVTVDDAVILAEKFTNTSIFYARPVNLRKAISHAPYEIKDEQTQQVMGYAFSYDPSGFVIVSGFYNEQPILAYSCTSTWEGNTSLQKSVKELIKGRNGGLSRNGLRSKQNFALWQKYLSLESIFDANLRQWPPFGTTRSGGWIETDWSTMIPYIAATYFPSFGGTTHAGCVPVAMSQLINFHKYIGDVSFSDVDRYSSPPFNIRIDQDSALYHFPSFQRLNGYLNALKYRYQNNVPINKQDVGALNFAAAVAVQAQFSSGATGAYSNYIYPALLTKFNYFSAKWGRFGDQAFGLYSIMKENIMNRLPFLMTMAAGGHEVIVDGYNSAGFFHFVGLGSAELWYSVPYTDQIGVISDITFDVIPRIIDDVNLKTNSKSVTLEHFILGAEPIFSAIDVKNESAEAIGVDSICVPLPYQISIDGINYANVFKDITIHSRSNLKIFIKFSASLIGRYDKEIVIYGNTKNNLIVALCGYALPQSGTIVEGLPYSDIMWDKEHSPYYILNDLYILGHLTVKAGVVVDFLGPYSLTLGLSSDGRTGQLSILGTETDSVIFNSSSTDGCGPIYFLCNETAKNRISFARFSNSKNIYGVSTGATLCGGAIAHHGGSLLIENCLIENNWATIGGGIFSRNGDLQIINCIIRNNHGFGYSPTGVNGGGVSVVRDNSNVDDVIEIVNSIIYGNTSFRNGGGVAAQGYGPLKMEIRNSIIYGNSAESGKNILISGDAEVLVEYSDIDTTVHNWLEGPLNWGNGNIAVDPGFIDPGRGNFYLLPDSPCIDKGDPSAVFNDVEDALNPGFALFPGLGTVRNDMGVFGGSFVTYGTVVDESQANTPLKYSLAQNYPNPFNATTRICYSIPAKSWVTLKLYDLLGREIKTLVQGSQSQGDHELTLDCSTLTNGIYFYKLQSGDFTETKKMMLIK